jgi:hypothetical protein
LYCAPARIGCRTGKDEQTHRVARQAVGISDQGKSAAEVEVAASENEIVPSEI